jgi:isopentenyl-diphosphate delta-isomerase type 1
MRIENTNCMVVRKEGKILLVKRGGIAFRGWLCFPGGHEEKGESHHQAAQREANEEIGEVKVENKPFLVFIHDWPVDGHTEEPHKHRCHVFKAKVAGELMAGDDAAELKWVTLEEASKLQITDYTRRVLELLEPFVVVDEKDNVIGEATRIECHSGSKIIHRAAAIIIVNSKGEMLAEKRSLLKDIHTGKWTMCVGGHLQPGEAYDEAAIREVREEIGVKCKPKFLFKMLVETRFEREMLSVFSCSHDGPFNANREEVDEIKFVSRKEVLEMTRKGRLSEFDTQYMRRYFDIKPL